VEQQNGHATGGKQICATVVKIVGLHVGASIITVKVSNGLQCDNQFHLQIPASKKASVSASFTELSPMSGLVMSPKYIPNALVPVTLVIFKSLKK
jgi:hypothetical protein